LEFSKHAQAGACVLAFGDILRTIDLRREGVSGASVSKQTFVALMVAPSERQTPVAQKT
jgi:hypothetical protein